MATAPEPNLEATLNRRPIIGTPRSRALSGSTVNQAWLFFGLLGLALVWSYWPTLELMVDRWARETQYSHGFLVPVFAAAVLWSRRNLLTGVVPSTSWWGLPVLAVGVVCRLLGGSMDIEPLDAFSLLPTLFGLVLLVGGGRVLRWAWPGLAFLAFMLPLPFSVETALAQPLRRLATVASTYALQTLGLPALAEGNIIILDTYRLGVIDACNGLGMLMTFFALATAMALVAPAPLADRLVLVASAIPIALISNVVRITATGVAYYWFGAAVAQTVLHDLAGWLMMPLALLLLWLELRLLARLFVVEGQHQPVPLPLPGAIKSPRI